MKKAQQIGRLECLLFVAGEEGLSLEQLVKLMSSTHIEVSNVLGGLAERYEQDEASGLILLEVAGRFQLATKKEYMDSLRQLVESPVQSTLSQASLETLAIIAYKQPLTRMDVDDIRGVQSDGSIRTLLAKGLIKEQTRSSGSRAKLYVTTVGFLDSFGLKDLTDLPQLTDEVKEINPEELDLFYERFSEKEAKGVNNGTITKNNRA